jgi:arylsulfatase A-like enzyme
VRLPAIMRWPARIAPGRVVDEVVSSLNHFFCFENWPYRRPAMGKRKPCTLALAASAILSACGGSGAVSEPSGRAPTPAPLVRPNIVLIVADDLDVPTMNQLLERRQPSQPLLDLLANQGLSFTRAYTTQALCSPGRASILTGQYTHNHRVYDNVGRHGGYRAFLQAESRSLAPWLQAAGYDTAFIGKYMNSHPDDGRIPPGWNRFDAHLTALENGVYFNYWMSHNGAARRYGAAQSDYHTDVLTNLATAYIRERAGQPKPLFLVVAPPAPHLPSHYAERHGGEFLTAGAPQVPSFDRADLNERTCWTPQAPALTPNDIRGADSLQRSRLRSMRALEDQYAAVLAALDQTGRLPNTYSFFASDNGLLMGQHRQVAKKNNAWEESINVPFIVRGPGVPAGRTDALAANIDIAPTILELAGVPVPESVDGRSLVPFLRGQTAANWRRDLLILNYDGDGSRPNEEFGGISLAVRDTDWMFQHRADDHFELFDTRTDPYQIRNEYCGADPARIAAFKQRIQTLSVCRGASCRT